MPPNKSKTSKSIRVSYWRKCCKKNSTENEGGLVVVYCIGQKPMKDYDIQATITEVDKDE